MTLPCPGLPRSFTCSLPFPPHNMPSHTLCFSHYPDPALCLLTLAHSQGSSSCPAATYLVSTPKEQRGLSRLARRTCRVKVWEAGFGVIHSLWGKHPLLLPTRERAVPCSTRRMFGVALWTEEYSNPDQSSVLCRFKVSSRGPVQLFCLCLLV